MVNHPRMPRRDSGRLLNKQLASFQGVTTDDPGTDQLNGILGQSEPEYLLAGEAEELDTGSINNKYEVIDALVKRSRKSGALPPALGDSSRAGPAQFDAALQHLVNSSCRIETQVCVTGRHR